MHREQPLVNLTGICGHVGFQYEILIQNQSFMIFFLPCRLDSDALAAQWDAKWDAATTAKRRGKAGHRGHPAAAGWPWPSAATGGEVGRDRSGASGGSRRLHRPRGAGRRAPVRSAAGGTAPKRSAQSGGSGSRPVSRVLSKAAIHLRRTSPCACSDLPGSGAGHASPPDGGSLPYLVLLRVGFALPPVLPPARCALTAPFHPCRVPSRTRGGLFSVALSVGSRPPGVTWHPALRSPDFPPPRCSKRRLPGRLPLRTV